MADYRINEQVITLGRYSHSLWRVEVQTPEGLWCPLCTCEMLEDAALIAVALGEYDLAVGSPSTPIPYSLTGAS